MSAQADAGHPQVGAETVAQGVHGRRLDSRAPTDVLQLLEDVAVALTGGIRNHPLFAGSIGVLLEKKLLHGRRNWNHALVGLRQPTSGLAWMNRIPRSKFRSFHVR